MAESSDATGRVKRTVGQLQNKVKWKVFGWRLERQRRINAEFDVRHGTDTAAEMDLDEAGVPTDDVARGNSVYRSLWESDFADALESLGTDFRGYTYVDLGSGKGKLLLLATNYPFDKIKGIEYAPVLHEIAVNNVEHFISGSEKCTAVEPVLGDAIAYEVPRGPVVFTIFNSFDPETTATVLRHIADTARGRTDPIFVIYLNMRTVSELGLDFASFDGLTAIEVKRTRAVLGNAAAVRQHAGVRRVRWSPSQLLSRLRPTPASTE